MQCTFHFSTSVPLLRLRIFRQRIKDSWTTSWRSMISRRQKWNDKGRKRFRNKGLVCVFPRRDPFMFTATESRRLEWETDTGAKTSSSLRMVMENHFDARRRTTRVLHDSQRTVLLRLSRFDFSTPADIRDCGSQSFNRLSG